jgi:1,4-dihydroxy-2-naphthoyl-CoA hydrolase
VTSAFNGLTLERAKTLGEGHFPGFVGLRFHRVAPGEIDSSVELGDQHRAPNGYLHAGVVVTLADTSCGYGVRTCASDEVSGFTTVELKSNFLATAHDGVVSCEARLTHGGRTTQVWDARVFQDDRTLALFRCTQLLLYPR